MAGGILALLGKVRPAEGESSGLPSKGGSSGDSPERMYAREAFGALKDDDEEGYIEALISTIKACTKKAEADEYEDDAPEL